METEKVEIKHKKLSLDDVFTSKHPLSTLKSYLDQPVEIKQPKPEKEFTKKDLARVYKELSRVSHMVQDEHELVSMGMYVFTELSFLSYEETIEIGRKKRPIFKNIREGLETLICNEYHLPKEDFPLLEIYFDAFREFTEATGKEPKGKDWPELLVVIEFKIEGLDIATRNSIQEARQVVGFKPINWGAGLGELDKNNRVVLIKDIFHNIHDQVTRKGPQSPQVDNGLLVEEIVERHQAENAVMSEIGSIGELRREIIRLSFGFSEEAGMGNKEMSVEQIHKELKIEAQKMMETTIEEIEELESIGDGLLSKNHAEFEAYYLRLGLKGRKIFKLLFFNEIDIEYPEINRVYDYEGIRQSLIYQGKDISKITIEKVKHLEKSAMRALFSSYTERRLMAFR